MNSVKAFVLWFGKFLSREFLLAVITTHYSYQLAQGGKLVSEWTAVLGVVAVYMAKRGYENVKSNGKASP